MERPLFFPIFLFLIIFKFPQIIKDTMQFTDKEIEALKSNFINEKVEKNEQKMTIEAKIGQEYTNS